MRFQCPQCRTGYRIDDARIPEKGVRSHCKNCGQALFVTHPGATVPPAARRPAPEPSAGQGPDLTRLENRLAELLAASDQEAAAGVLLEMVSCCVNARDFSRAETLRDRMYEETPMALTEVIEAGDIIEAGKRDSMDPEHLECWKSLYAALTPEETAELYSAMESAAFAKGAPIVRQGDPAGRLLLVEGGRVKLTCLAPETSSTVNIWGVRAGEILGRETFFSYSVFTFSAEAAEECRLRFIAKPHHLRWLSDKPGLESKLRTYCAASETVSQIVVRQEIERRAAERRKADRKASIRGPHAGAIPDDGTIPGRIGNVSTGGACLDVKLDKPEQAQALIGAALTVDLTFQVSGAEKPASLQARAVAVTFHGFGEGTLHIRFAKPIDEKYLPFFAS